MVIKLYHNSGRNSSFFAIFLLFYISFACLFCWLAKIRKLKYIKGVIEGLTDDCLSSADKTTQLVSRIAEEIIVEVPDRLSIKLKNGTIIRTIEEDSNGSCGE